MLPMRQRAQRLLRRQAVLEVARRFQAPAASTSAEFVRLLDLVRGERGSSTPGKLSLGSLLLSDADLVQLGAFLTKPGSDHIQTLDLRHNDLYKRQVGLASLVDILVTSKHSITSLDVRANKLGDQGCATVFRLLSNDSTLKEMNVWDNGMSARGTLALAEHLENNTCLEALNIGSNGVQCAGVDILATALGRSSTRSAISELILRSNHIADKGAKALGNLLKKQFPLRSLSLWNNDIECEGAYYLAEGLFEMKLSSADDAHGFHGMEVLDLRANDIDQPGVDALMDAVHANPGVVKHIKLLKQRTGIHTEYTYNEDADKSDHTTGWKHIAVHELSAENHMAWEMR